MGDGIETTRTTVADGVRVRKTIETGPDDWGTVTLDVELEREAPTLVRVTEPALGAVPRDDIELHADHGAEYWRIDETAIFEREFEAGESYAVVYRVADVDADRFEAIDDDPAVEVTDPPLDGIVAPEDADPVRELIDGERESLAATAPGGGGVELSLESSDHAGEDSADRTDDPAVGDAAEASADEPVDGTGGGDDDAPVGPSEDDTSGEISVEVSAGGDPPAGDEESAVSPADDSPDGPADGPSPAAEEASDSGLGASLAATPSGGVARVLLRELREGHVDDETVEELRSELEPGRSQEVRIKHLQSQVGDFAAYVEMLESVVDEHGPFESIFEEFEADMATLDEEVGAVRSDLEDVADLDEAVGSLSADVDELRSEVGAMESDVEGLRTGQDDLQADHEDLEARIEAMEAELEAELETIHERLEQLETFREQLSGAFQE